jgi:hypothetical protein
VSPSTAELSYTACVWRDIPWQPRRSGTWDIPCNTRIWYY